MSNYKKMTKEQLIAKYEKLTREQLIAKIERLEKSKKEVEDSNHRLAYEILDLNNKLESIKDILGNNWENDWD
jgi:uncharacterized protein (UPF0335 family)